MQNKINQKVPIAKMDELITAIRESGGGGGKLYLHNVTFPDDSSTTTNPNFDGEYNLNIRIINNDNTPITFESLRAAYKSNNIVSINGYCIDKQGAHQGFCDIFVFTSTKFTLVVTGSSSSFNILSEWAIEDNVIEL